MDSQRFQHLHEVSFLKRSCDQDPLLEQEAANRSPVATKDHPNTNSGTNITHIVLCTFGNTLYWQLVPSLGLLSSSPNCHPF